MVRWNFRKRALVVVPLVAAAVVGGYFYVRHPRVEVVRVSRRDVLQTVVASGRVHVAGDVELSVKIAGRVTEIPVQEGEHVVAGQVLLKLDDAEAKVALAEARASVARSLVEVRRIRQKATPLAQASLRRAEVDVAYAEAELARSQQLSAVGAYTTQQLEQARQAVALAGTRRETAQVELSNTLPAGADREMAVASMRQAEAALSLAQLRLAECQVLAPSDGTVVDIAVDAGDSVQPGRALVRMVIDGPVQLEMEPDERNLALLALDQAARASAEAFASESFEARVSYIAPKVDPDRGTIKVRLDVPQPPRYLRADMTVSIEIEVAHAGRALVVPTRVVRDLATTQPWVVVLANGRTQRRDVTIGVRGEDMVEVLSGVTEGAVVIAEPDVELNVAVKPLEPTP